MVFGEMMRSAFVHGQHLQPRASDGEGCKRSAIYSIVLVEEPERNVERVWDRIVE